MYKNSNTIPNVGEGFSSQNGVWKVDDDAIIKKYSKDKKGKAQFKSQDNIEEVMRYFQKYNLDEESLDVLRSFITVKYHQNEYKRLTKRDFDVMCNLIIETKDRCQAGELIQDIHRFMGEPEIVYTNEKEFVKDGEMEKVDFAESPNGIIVIENCGHKPIRNHNDDDSTSRGDMKQKIKRYEALWELLKEDMEKTPGHTYIIVAEPAVCKSTISEDKDLYDVFASYHIKLAPYTAKQVYDMCLDQAVDMCPEAPESSFVEGLKDYVERTYMPEFQQADTFVNYLMNRVKQNFLTIPHERLALNANDVPVLDTKAKTLEQILSPLESFVGMNAIRDELESIYYEHKGNAKSEVRSGCHLILRGNPGTGKTVVARKISQILFDMGILPTDKFTEASSADVLSLWTGGSLDKMSTLIDNADGGVLFIDEAYALVENDKKSTQDTVAHLLKAAEDRSDRLVIILAGYKDKMEAFCNSNPGLKSRFRIVDMPDYSVDELESIFCKFCEKDGLTLEEEALEPLRSCINAMRSEKDFANARSVRNLYNRLKNEMHRDTANEGTLLIRASYVEKYCPVVNGGIKSMVGLKQIKKKIKDYEKAVIYRKAMEKEGYKLGGFNMNMSLVGNPGTGKSTVAEIIANDFYKAGVLPSNRVSTLTRGMLVGTHIGQTEQKVKEVLEKGYGGVIFIDEAYALARGGELDFGKQVVDELLRCMLDHINDTIFIFAGYPDEMQSFWDLNPGLRSRVFYHFALEDYTETELTRMYLNKLEKIGYTVESAVAGKITELMLYFMPMKHFGNGRFVDLIIDSTISKRANRGIAKGGMDIKLRDVPTIREVIENLGNSGEFYDPSEISPEARQRTAYHELGHAIASITYGIIPEKISVQNQIGSLGRVTIKNQVDNMTSTDCFNRIVTLLSGKNAERLMLGNHSTGVCGDFDRAKKLAEAMKNMYAMNEFGTADEILKKADEASVELLAKYADFIEKKSKQLLGGRAIKGSTLAKHMQVADSNDVASMNKED